MKRCISGLFVLFCLASCSRTSDPHHTRIDWQQLDHQAPWIGWAFVNHAMHGSWQPSADILYNADWDSLGTDEFQALPEATQGWRREAAAELVQQAFLAVADRSYRRRDGVVRRSLDNYPLVMTRVLRRLHTAVGTDPGSADAWFHLAYFSQAIGDRPAAARARGQFLAISDHPDRRARVILDEAWERREAGLYPACLTLLDEHDQALATAASGDPRLTIATEADLLRALCHAEQGQDALVTRYLARLPDIPLRRGSRTVMSNDLRTWTRAWLNLRRGDHDLAAWHLGYLSRGRRPAAIARRFWQDIGQIASELGDDELTLSAWLHAFLEWPMKVYFPQSVHQHAGELMAFFPYFLAYDQHFLAGSFWSYTAGQARACLAIDPASAPRRWQAAHDNLDICVRRNFEPQLARLMRARLSLQQGDWVSARSDLKAIELADQTDHRTQADLHFLLGAASLGTGDLTESLAWLEHCLTLDKTHVGAWQAVAIAYAYSGDDDKALAAFDQLARLRPFDGPNYFNRGLWRLQRGDQQGATADLERAALLMPHNKRVVTLLQAVATGREIEVDLTPQPVQIAVNADLGEPRSSAIKRTTAAAGALEQTLVAERDAGSMTTALAIATGEIAAADLDGMALLLALTTLLDHDRRAEAQAVHRLALSLVADQPAILELMERMLR